MNDQRRPLFLPWSPSERTPAIGVALIIIYYKTHFECKVAENTTNRPAREPGIKSKEDHRLALQKNNMAMCAPVVTASIDVCHFVWP